MDKDTSDFRLCTRIYTASVECLKDPELYQKTLSLLPPQRRESADRMKVESGKRLSAGAGLLLMTALARSGILEPEFRGCDSPGCDSVGCDSPGCDSVGCDSPGYDSIGYDSPGLFSLRLSSLRFAQGEYGKPYLPEYPQAHFNLSHSGNRVMCIVSPVPCGCDVERIERSQKQIDMVIRCLAESEQRLAAVSPVHFFRIWTLKESILKLSGKGLGIPFDSFEVSLDPLSVRQDFIHGSVALKEYDTFRTADGGLDGLNVTGDANSITGAEQYCCACALSGAKPPEEMIQVDLREVVTGRQVRGKAGYKNKKSTGKQP